MTEHKIEQRTTTGKDESGWQTMVALDIRVYEARQAAELCKKKEIKFTQKDFFQRCGLSG
jgi:hypothetical protein